MSKTKTKQKEYLTFQNIHKNFGRIKALKGVSFSVHDGEILGLVGDNGAGKSTLIKVLAGIHQPSKGIILVNGEKVKIRSPKDARSLGIEFVHQDVGLAKDLEVRRNMFLGDEPIRLEIGPLEILDIDRMTKETRRGLSETVGILSDISPTSTVADLSGGERQAIKIGRAIWRDANLVVLDEPVRALSIREKRKIRQLISDLNDQNISFIYITHNIHEIYSIADRFVILDRGEKVAETNKDEVTMEELELAIAEGKLEK